MTPDQARAEVHTMLEKRCAAAGISASPEMLIVVDLMSTLIINAARELQFQDTRLQVAEDVLVKLLMKLGFVQEEDGELKKEGGDAN